MFWAAAIQNSSLFVLDQKNAVKNQFLELRVKFPLSVPITLA
ncbi:hypothetical protein Xvie_01212 [Xenorhabdus vietnamensis]|uniref:Uncharacterized protein n=1 Tax=Xenorhabdus vietnamensis TaxID=351656 RepID=A0A1Y2SH86_9GAMM|nr:hypothetical protein Xvie_01212 [Xenorhabdus vietnamensis]